MGFSVREFLIGTVLGALLQTVLQLALEERFRRARDRLSRRWAWLRGRFGQNGMSTHTQGLFQIGDWKANWVVVEGSAAHPYERDNVICHLDDNELELPPDLSAAKRRIEEEEEARRREKGASRYYNGPMVALMEILTSRVGQQESPLLVLRFRRTDYYSFLATSLQLDSLVGGSEGVGRTIRDKYLRGIDFAHPIGELATSFGVNMAFITRDGYLPLVTRALGIGPYPGYYSTPISESVQPVMDLEAGGLIGLHHTVKRGAHEELGVEVADDEIVFFCIGVDTVWYQYSMNGMILSSAVTRGDLTTKRGIGVKDKWETASLFFAPFEPDGAARYLSQMPWHHRLTPAALVCIVQALIREYGQPSVEKAFAKWRP